jgi:hypothetical protein
LARTLPHVTHLTGIIIVSNIEYYNIFVFMFFRLQFFEV